MTRTLNLDLDGLMADFHYGFQQISDIPLKGIDDSVMWSIIDKHPSFFEGLPPIPGAIDFFREVRHLNPVILTACPAHNYVEIARQKRRWVAKHMHPSLVVLPVTSGLLKHVFMNRPGDILVDDYGKNLVEWEKAGGVGIKHEGEDFDSTLRLLAAAGIGQASDFIGPTDVDFLAQEIRAVDGSHSLGAAALAERLMPAITSRWGRPASATA